MTENLNQTIIQLVQKELSDYRPKQLTTVLNLLNEGNTVPFIARYRKEMTGSLDEVQIREIEERYAYLENLEKRKTEVIRLIDEQGKLTRVRSRNHPSRENATSGRFVSSIQTKTTDKSNDC